VPRTRPGHVPGLTLALPAGPRLGAPALLLLEPALGRLLLVGAIAAHEESGVLGRVEAARDHRLEQLRRGVDAGESLRPAVEAVRGGAVGAAEEHASGGGDGAAALEARVPRASPLPLGQLGQAQALEVVHARAQAALEQLAAVGAVEARVLVAQRLLPTLPARQSRLVPPRLLAPPLRPTQRRRQILLVVVASLAATAVAAVAPIWGGGVRARTTGVSRTAGAAAGASAASLTAVLEGPPRSCRLRRRLRRLCRRGRSGRRKRQLRRGRRLRLGRGRWGRGRVGQLVGGEVGASVLEGRQLGVRQRAAEDGADLAVGEARAPLQRGLALVLGRQRARGALQHLEELRLRHLLLGARLRLGIVARGLVVAVDCLAERLGKVPRRFREGS